MLMLDALQMTATTAKQRERHYHWVHCPHSAAVALTAVAIVALG